MPREKTKTWEAREGRLDAELEEMLRKHIQGANPDDYLFADSLWRCGKRPMGNGTYGKAWDRMRTDLKLPKEYQLYSLKDTAINSMLKAGVDDLSVMQAAGHKDLSMTTIYANHHDDKLIDNLNQKAPKFAVGQ
jgi:integrase